jgi:hypothetical protein
LFACPSRRNAEVWPVLVQFSRMFTKDEFKLPIVEAARSDYAINTGDFGRGSSAGQPGKRPQTFEEADAPDFEWYSNKEYTGVSFGRSEIRNKDVQDGLSKTYLVAEKNVQSIHYTDGFDPGDNETMYNGFDDDTCRSALLPPMPDEQDAYYNSQFGSCHPGIWSAVYCDGSVHGMGFNIDPEIHKRFANRADGKAVSSGNVQ